MREEIERLRELIAEAKRLAEERRLGTLTYLLSLAEGEAANARQSDVEPTSLPVPAPPRRPRLFSPRRR